MKRTLLSLLSVTLFAVPMASASEIVNVDNFTQATSELAFLRYQKTVGGLGKIGHYRQLVPLDKQGIIRMNRDTLYSWAIFDVQNCPVTITKPELDPGRYQSLQIFNQNHYAPLVAYKSGQYKITKELLGSRYGSMVVRTGLVAHDPQDLEKVRTLQNGLKIVQNCEGSLDGFSDWDLESLNATKNALLGLVPFQGDNSRRMGPNAASVDMLKHLLVTASGYGSLPLNGAKYLNVYPQQASGKTPYTLNFDSPDLDYDNGGFWSITVYNAEGFIEENPQGAYVINNKNAIANADGSYTIHFGGDANADNFLPIEGIEGWNYSVRLYLPSEEVQKVEYSFPSPVINK